MRGIGRGCEGESPGVREGVDVRRCQREGVGVEEKGWDMGKMRR